MSVRIITNFGELWIKLFVEETPNNSLNFIKLCKIKYYNWCIFHNVQKGFIAQSGDASGRGTGGKSLETLLAALSGSNKAGYAPDEFRRNIKHDGKGLLGMVSGGKDRNASQFYITLTEEPLTFLDGKYTIIGKVVGGLEVLDRINNVFVDGSQRPFEDIFIRRIIVEADPFPDPPNLDRLMPERTPPPSEAFTSMRRPAANEENPEEVGLTETELEERRNAEKARAHALNLVLLGDLPSVDARPPENILFVCRLNPITTSNDLRMIFSRFGAIASCEVIKDRVTDASLGYAFIEFEEREACEQAYLKMNNVIIDDKRIKVDFSQSVARPCKSRDGLGVANAEKADPMRVKHDSHVRKHENRRDHRRYRGDDDSDYRPRRRSRSRSKDRKDYNGLGIDRCYERGYIEERTRPRDDHHRPRPRSKDRHSTLHSPDRSPRTLRSKFHSRSPQHCSQDHRDRNHY